MVGTLPVFVIDDDAAARDSLAALLSMNGISVASFASAEEFLAACDLTKPGVVLCDLLLGGLSGEQLQQQLISLNSPIVLVIVTGVADVASAVRLMQRGAMTLLQKPVVAEQLLPTIEEGVRQSVARYEARRAHHEMSVKIGALTSDDRAILEGMITGRPIKSCAMNLNLSTRTVERRRKAILEILGAPSIPELAVKVASFFPSAADPSAEAQTD